MYQILEEWLINRKKSDFFLVKVRTYKVAYPRNSGYNTNHKYAKDIGYNSDIAVLYRRIKSENLCMYQYLFREESIIIDA